MHFLNFLEFLLSLIESSRLGGATPFSITTFRIVTLSLKGLCDTQHKRHSAKMTPNIGTKNLVLYADCRILFIVVLNAMISITIVSIVTHLLSVIMLNVLMLSFIMLCHYAVCYYATCHYAECYYAECYYAECYYAECYYAECYYAECYYAECYYAECCHA